MDEELPNATPNLTPGAVNFDSAAAGVGTAKRPAEEGQDELFLSANINNYAYNDCCSTTASQEGEQASQASASTIMTGNLGVPAAATTVSASKPQHPYKRPRLAVDFTTFRDSHGGPANATHYAVPQSSDAENPRLYKEQSTSSSLVDFGTDDSIPSSSEDTSTSNTMTMPYLERSPSGRQWMFKRSSVTHTRHRHHRHRDLSVSSTHTERSDTGNDGGADDEDFNAANEASGMSSSNRGSTQDRRPPVSQVVVTDNAMQVETQLLDRITDRVDNWSLTNLKALRRNNIYATGSIGKAVGATAAATAAAAASTQSMVDSPSSRKHNSLIEDNGTTWASSPQIDWKMRALQVKKAKRDMMRTLQRTTRRASSESFTSLETSSIMMEDETETENDGDELGTDNNRQTNGMNAAS